ncbi:3-beta hydroxysteroid dehydrogenase/isomerase family protein [Clohesyomyces aquaticus]|uniref:3-beta hydroxysteroid dehydrogenase/isomerase family protein n=1 Tax=Clohesyomyces aquaticus TaxID=1231657 RepID=A0A1Y1YXY7_9PLEO|nr:3-beta hydroxysteroid dehydrogenase/isomerase family protein [Clohesyomyces aquaticus]
MSPSTDPGLVAITGANGTIGYHSTLHALRTGYRVRCIVRRESAIQDIKAGPSIQKYIDEANGKVEFKVVQDNTVEGAYDEVLRGVEWVVHVAGVWPLPHYHPDNDVYYPFVKSMENILSAATKAGTVKRIVFTQAAAALVSVDKGDSYGTCMESVLDEFVPVSEQSSNTRPPLPSVHHAYSSAKANCMTHLRSLQASHSLPFSIVQVIPGTVIGPSELITTPTSALATMDRMSKALLFNAHTPRYAFGFVHVADCAAVHIEALNTTKVRDSAIPHWFVAAATTEGDVKNGKEVWRRTGEMVEREFKREIGEGMVSVGRERCPVNMPFRVDSKMTERVLLAGERMRGLEECVREVGEWYLGLVRGEREREKGW